MPSQHVTKTEPFCSEKICVSKTIQHSLFVIQYGSPRGVPIVFVHGGPGGQCQPKHILNMKVFDLSRFRLVFFDQRGCGRSTPRNELRQNTPQHTVSDIEHIRKHYQFNSILLYGQSYGTSLVMLYAKQYPQHVLGCMLHGVFLCEDVFPKSLLDKHPRIWKRLQTATQKKSLHDVSKAVYQSIRYNKTNKRKVMRDWCALEASECNTPVSQLNVSAQHTLALMETYYHNHAFFHCNTLCKENHPLQHVPILIMHGEHDMICPIENAKRLHQSIKQSSFIPIPNGKHRLQFNRNTLFVKQKIKTFVNQCIQHELNECD